MNCLPDPFYVEITPNYAQYVYGELKKAFQAGGVEQSDRLWKTLSSDVKAAVRPLIDAEGW